MSEKLYFLYARVSNDDYLESVDTQLSMLTAKADDPRNKFKYSRKTIMGEDQSGSTGTRSMFNDMISSLMKDSAKPPKEREYEGVLFFKLDRLFRNPKDFHQVEILMDLGYKFVSATETIENTPTGRLLFRMLAGFAIYESDKLSSRVSLTYLTNALKNQFNSLGGRLIMGYRMEEVTGGKKALRVVPEEKELINFIYSLRANDPDMSVKEIFNSLSDIPHYCEITENLIRSREEKNAKSKEKTSKRRARIEEIIQEASGETYEEEEDSGEEGGLVPENTLKFEAGESFETSATKIINSCLYNNSKYRYDGHFTKTFKVKDELIQGYLKHLASLDEDDYENEFKGTMADWEKTEYQIGEEVTFQFFIPELVIVESEKYRRVQDSINRKEYGTDTKLSILTMFNRLMHVEDSNGNPVLMGFYPTKKGTINYRVFVEGESVEKSELKIKKAILQSSLFENRDRVFAHKDFIMNYIMVESRRETTKIIRRETMKITIYNREIKSITSAMGSIMQSIEPGKDNGLFDIFKNEIETYRTLIEESQRILREAENMNLSRASLFFHLLSGDITQLNPEEQRLAYIVMFERIVMTMDKRKITIHLRQFMADILGVPKEFDISLT